MGKMRAFVDVGFCGLLQLTVPPSLQSAFTVGDCAIHGAAFNYEWPHYLKFSRTVCTKISKSLANNSM